MKYIIAFLVLSIIIIVHEFGHFILAKASGVTVTEFSLGMGPRLLKFRKNGTLYSFKLFLFGGSCRMLGEDEDNDNEGSFNTKSVWKRIAIVAAGPIFNFIFAFIMAIILIGKIGYDPCVIASVDKGSAAEAAGLEAGDHITDINGTNITFYGDYNIYVMQYNDGRTFEITYTRDGKEMTTTLEPEYIANVFRMGINMSSDKATVDVIGEDTPAEEAGMQVGDLVVSINGTPVSDSGMVSELVQENGDQEMTVVVERDGKEITLTMVPQQVSVESYSTGMSMSGVREKVGPLDTVKYSFQQVGYWIKTVFVSLKMMFTGQVSMNDVSGPVGIVNMIGNVVEQSQNDGILYIFLNLVNWTIIISANLGVMNLLPIPALDGGRLVFLVIEAVRRKPVPREKEGMVHFVGIVLLMILMVFVMFNDIRKLF